MTLGKKLKERLADEEATLEVARKATDDQREVITNHTKDEQGGVWEMEDWRVKN